MTDDAVQYVRSGDGPVAYRVVGSGPSVASMRTLWSRLGGSATVMGSKRRWAAAMPEGE
jgi:hypothetical protein